MLVSSLHKAIDWHFEVNCRFAQRDILNHEFWDANAQSTGIKKYQVMFLNACYIYSPIYSVMYDCSKHILPNGKHIVSSGMTGFLCLPSPLNTLFPICRVWICYIVMDDVKQTTISLCSQQTLLVIRSSRTDLSNGILSFWQEMIHNTTSDIFAAKHFLLIHEQNAQWPSSGWHFVL